MHGLVPLYLSEDCQLVTDVGRRHGSSDVYTCIVPRTQSQIGDRSFSVARPQLWNNLQTEIRSRGTTFGHYRRLLKAFLFVYAVAHCDFYLSAPGISTLTHSLTPSAWTHCICSDSSMTAYEWLRSTTLYLDQEYALYTELSQFFVVP